MPKITHRIMTSELARVERAAVPTGSLSHASDTARAELRSWRSSVDEVVVGEMDSAPSPASGSSLDVVVNELPMDFNSCFICTNGEPVSPHTRRPYCGRGARTVGGGVTR